MQIGNSVGLNDFKLFHTHTHTHAKKKRHTDMCHCFVFLQCQIACATVIWQYVRTTLRLSLWDKQRGLLTPAGTHQPHPFLQLPQRGWKVPRVSWTSILRAIRTILDIPCGPSIFATGVTEGCHFDGFRRPMA